MVIDFQQEARKKRYRIKRKVKNNLSLKGYNNSLINYEKMSFFYGMIMNSETQEMLWNQYLNEEYLAHNENPLFISQENVIDWFEDERDLQECLNQLRED